MRSVLAITTAAVLTLVACSGSDDADPADTATSDTEATETAPADTTEPDVVETEPPVTDVVETEPSTDEPAPSDDDATVADDGTDVDPSDAPPTTIDPVTTDDLAVFVAAAERTLEGTSYELAVLADAEIYIALGQSACARFSDGADFDAVAGGLLAALTEGTDEHPDDAILVGAVIGAATETICPEHADQV